VAFADPLDLRLPFVPPLNPDNLFGHLAATAVPGVEEWRAGWYRRTLQLTGGAGVLALRPRARHVDCRLDLADPADAEAAVAVARWLVDLDADPGEFDAALSRAEPALAPLIAAAPGRRIPRTVDPAEFAVRAVLGQQVSTAAARTHAARLVTSYGTALDGDPEHGGGLTHLWPTVEALAALDPETLAMPASRRRTLTGLIAALSRGELSLDPQGDLATTRARLLSLPGFGPWTVEVIAMRALGDPDAFPASDLGVLRAGRALGLAGSARELARVSEAWRPWRSYAVQYLWATGEHAINRLPG
jgi:AraC family transcriptional regulator, regulatory protein of adaptative response / DNA-3-methyladenine glycosylase II